MGGGGNPSKKLINGGGLTNGGSEIRKKRVFTLSTGDKCILRVHCNDFFF